MTKPKSLINLFWSSILILNILFFLGLLGILGVQELKDAKDQFHNIRNTYVSSQKDQIRLQIKELVKYIHHEKSLAEERVRREVRARTLEAYRIASYIYEKYKKEKSVKEIKNLIHDALHAASWDDGKGYYFAQTIEGVGALNRNNPNLVGVNFLDVKDKRINKVMRDVIEIGKSPEGEGFYSYIWNKPEFPESRTPKISYFHYFEPIKWIIGNGKYIADEEEKIKKEVLEHIEKIDFKTSEYIFVGTYDGVMLVGPFKNENTIEATDPRGMKIIQKIIDTSKNGGGFVEYIAPEYKEQQQKLKISYVEGVKDWGWFVGTGMYADAVEPLIIQKQGELKQKMNRLVGKTIAIFVLFLVFLFYLTWYFSDKIKNNIKIFTKFFNESATRATPIDPEEIYFTEFCSLAASANYMAEERQKAWEALEKSENRLHQVIEASHIPMAIYENNGEIYFLNQKFTELFGYTMEDIDQVSIYLSLAYPDPDYRENVIDKWVEAVKKLKATGAPIKEFITSVTCKDGSVKLIEYGHTFVERWNLTTFHDLTAKRKAENEKRQLEEKLHQAQKMEAIGTLARGVAHDLNNILSGIISYPELLLMQLPEDSNLRKPIEAIQTCGERAANVVADLLTVARGIAANKEVSNLNLLIRDFLSSEEYKNIMSAHPNLEVIPDLQEDLPNLCCSKVHINKTIVNLVLNAIESTGNEGRIVITTRSQYIDEPLLNNQSMKPGDYVVLSVEDNGCGISATDIDRIFEPFYTKKVMGRSGSGLGLAIVWNTVRDHDGGVTVLSDQAKTVFEMYFPATRHEIKAQVQDIEISELTGNGEEILIVDDEEHQRKIASELATTLGYHAYALPSGEEAVMYLLENPVVLVILDMIMDPGMNGRKTYEKIIEIYPGQKAIIASGFSENEDVKKAQELGAGIFLKKPYTIKQLGAAIKETLGK